MFVFVFFKKPFNLNELVFTLMLYDLIQSFQ